MKHIVALFFAAGIAALLLSTTPATAQTAAAKAKAFDKGVDVSESWGEKVVKPVAGLKSGDEVKSTLSFFGEVSVATGDATVVSKTSSDLIVSTRVTKPAKGEWLEAEFKYLKISIDQNTNGRKFGLFVDGNSDSANGVWVDGEKKDGSAPAGLPTASAVKTGMGQPVAYARLSNANYSVSRLAQSARFSESTDDSIPHRLIDPGTLMRLLFAGIAGRESKLNQAVSFDAQLSLDTATGATAAYTVKLTPKKVFAKDKAATELSAALYDIEATPAKDAKFALAGGVSVPAPVITGTALIDMARGIVMHADLAATLAADSDGTKVAGTVKVTIDVPKE